jgi:hypothetical protein
VSEIKLNDDITIDSAQIESAKLLKKGETISNGVTGQRSGESESLTAPEDELIVTVRNGTEFAVRGEREVKRAWDALEQARKAENLNFSMTVGDHR